MLVVDGHFYRLRALEVWWPVSPEATTSLASRAPVINVMQCNADIATALGSLTFHRRPFQTVLIDLSLPEARLWSRLDQRSCRTEINRAKRLDCVVSRNERSDDAFRLLRDFIRRRGYRAPLSAKEWQRQVLNNDVFVVHHEGHPVACHVVQVDGTARARVVSGATVQRGTLPGAIVGALNRYLLWEEMRYYREGGVGHFDLGGITLDETSPLFSITRFKMSFGGDVVEEHIVHLARSPTLRLALRAMARAKAAAGQARHAWARTTGVRPGKRDNGSAARDEKSRAERRVLSKPEPSRGSFE